MKRRIIISVFLSAACLSALWMVRTQWLHINELQGEHQKLLAEAAASVAPTVPVEPVAPRASPPVELLRLRGEVTSLMTRERELAGVRAENEQLQTRLAAKATNPPALPVLPEGYLLRSQAQFRGCSTPEDAVESLLWTLHNRDVQNYLLTLTPEAAQQFSSDAQTSPDYVKQFLNAADELPGLRVVDSELQADGSVILKLEYVPGLYDVDVPLRLVNGEWKIDANLFD